MVGVPKYAPGLDCTLWCDVAMMFCSCEGGSSTRQACPAGTYSAGDAESSSSACTVSHTSILLVIR